MSVIYQIVNTEPDPPSTHRQGLSPELDAIVMKAIAKDPAKRFATWDEFGAGARRDLEEGRRRARRSATSRTPSASASRARCRSSASFPRTSSGRCCASRKWAKFRPDTVLIKEGDHGDSFYILAGGYVRITRGKRTLNVLTAGDCFGEMSYLAHNDRAHRSATVTTTSDVHRDEDPRRGPARGLAFLPAPLRRALPQHARRPPRERQPAARR